MQEILNLARSVDPEERETAARQLSGQTLTESVRSTLLELMSDPDWRVRGAAVDSILKNPVDDWIPLMFNALYEESNAGKRNAAMEILSRFGARVLPHLPQQLQKGDTDVKMFLAYLLGSLRDASHLSFLTDCLQHPEPNLVSAAIVALGQIGDTSSVPHLIEFLHGENLWFQIQAIEAAGEMQEEALLPHILPLLNSTYCKTTVLKALGKFHHPEAYRALISTFGEIESGNPDSLQSIVRILEAPQPEILRAKDRSSIRSLAKELLSTDLQEILFQKMQNDAIHSSSSTRPSEQTPNVEGLLQQLKHENASVREKAAASLKQFESNKVTDALLASIGDEDPWVRVAIYNSLNAAETAVKEVFNRKISTENPIVQAAMLRCLGRSKDPSVASVLIHYLHHEDPDIRAATCEALGHCRNEEVENHLQKHFTQDASWMVRVASLRSLHMLRPDGKNLPLLERLEADPDPSVRKEILRILNECRITPSDPVFDLLCDPQLADSAATYLLSYTDDKERILRLANNKSPAIRRIVERLFV